MNQPPSLPRALTKEQIKLLSRHAAERAELEAEQHNDRVAMQERHHAELQVAMGENAAEAPIIPMQRKH